MARIGFYHLERQRLADVLPKLMEKALEAGFRVKVLTSSATESERLDDALWTYEAGSFLPHGRVGGDWEGEQPILIGEDEGEANGATLLCQTGGAEARSLDPFSRVLDIFDGRDEVSLQQARDRWRRYKSAGHALEYHQERPGGGWDRKA